MELENGGRRSRLSGGIFIDKIAQPGVTSTISTNRLRSYGELRQAKVLGVEKLSKSKFLVVDRRENNLYWTIPRFGSQMARSKQGSRGKDDFEPDPQMAWDSHTTVGLHQLGRLTASKSLDLFSFEFDETSRNCTGATGRYALEEIASRCRREQAEVYLVRPGASDSNQRAGTNLVKDQ